MPTTPSSTVHDVALIFEGGGMRAALTSAVVAALLDAGIYCDFATGISAGSSNTVNYLARDPQRARRSFVEFVSDPRFGSWRTFARGEGWFNARYIYEETSLPDQALPLDFETFQANDAAFAIGAFRCGDGQEVYWGRDDVATLRDLLVRVRASSTMPVLMPPVTIDGQVYVDGALGPTGGIALDAARAAGYERFLIILTQERGYVKEPLRYPGFYRRHFRRYPAVADALLSRFHRYNETREEVFELERSGQAMVFAPEIMPISNGERNVAKLAAAHQLGLAQAGREVGAWKEFCGLA